MRSTAYQPLAAIRWLIGIDRALLVLLITSLLSCATSGSTWMSQPLSSPAWGEDPAPAATPPPDAAEGPEAALPARVEARVIGGDDRTGAGFVNLEGPPAALGVPGFAASAPASARAPGGRVLGTFRNTYYDFPSEADFSGQLVALKDSRCKTIKNVARAFYEAVCVQGSGALSSGRTVSFAKRDCACAEPCPRTEQHICFDELDAKAFPWGRGATGRAITPLLSIAVDSELVPLDTPVYIPEYDGLPRDLARSSLHDGCFIAQDRGVHVKGEHVDIFTGQREITALWNRLLPSNRGVTLIVDHPRCARAELIVSH